MKISGKPVWIISAVLIITGVVFTVKDYREWRHAEWDKYGQGYADNRSPALPLNKLYESKVGVRLRYPEGWQISREGRIPEVLPGEEEFNVAEWGEMMTMRIIRTEKTLPDTVVEEKNLVVKSGRMLGEGEGLQLETAEGRILTWETGLPGKDQTVWQEAIVKRGEKVVKVTCKVETEKWPEWEKTWLEIFKSLVLF